MNADAAKRLGSFCRRGMLALILSIGTGGAAGAAIVDLTGGEGASGTLNGVIYEYGARRAAGTGNINTFVSLKDSGVEEGYNTSARPVQFDENNSGQVTHDLQVERIPIVEREGVDYYEFILDANESQGGSNQFISLDQVKIYTSATNFGDDENPADPDLLGTLRYNMDAGDPGNHVRIDTSNAGSGSGSTDMSMLVPFAAFGDALPGHYVYVYSVFGGQGNVCGAKYGTGDGFEEWAVETFPGSVFAPEPATAVLMALGGVGAALRLRRRRTRR